MSDGSSINDLARQARSGDMRAYELLVVTLTPKLMGYLIRKGGVDAEEITQETWLSVAGGLDSYDDGRDFKTWLFGIAFYHWVNEMRRQGKLPIELIDSVPDSSFDDPVSCREWVDAVHDCLQTLDDELRSILVLYYWDEMTLQDVAMHMGITYGSCKGKADRARSKLRHCITRKFS